MTWLLDTNACIRYLNGRSAKLRDRFDVVDPSQICVCSVVKAELHFGAALSKDPIRTLAHQRLFLSRFIHCRLMMQWQKIMATFELT